MVVDVWCPQVNDIVIRKGGKTNGTYGRVTESNDEGVKIVMVPVKGTVYEQHLRLSTVVACYELLRRPDPDEVALEDAVKD